MDANGLRSWMLARAEDWRPSPEARWDAARGTLRMASRRARPLVEDEAVATARLNRTPASTDAYGNLAASGLRQGRSTVLASGVTPDPVPILPQQDRDGRDIAAPFEIITDLAAGWDGVLTVAIAGRVVLADLRRSWAPLTLTGFPAWRVAPRPQGGAWLLSRDGGLGRWTGTPTHEPPYVEVRPDTFRPDPDGPVRPTIEVIHPDAGWLNGARAVALACSADGRLAVLTWGDDAARLRLLDPDGAPTHSVALAGVRFPWSLAWFGVDQVAVMVALAEAPKVPEALVFPLQPGAPTAWALGDVHPLRDHDGGPFVHAPSPTPHVRSGGRPTTLKRLSLPSVPRQADASSARPFDAGQAGISWHRLYVEAVLPPGCGVELRLAASDEPTPPDAPEAWHPHRFGAVPGDAADAPQGAWLPQASELPLHPGLLPCAPHPDRAGLFTALIQRPGRAVRTLQGRYLWVQATLHGDGRSSPELAAVRAWAPRFSYVTHYLPELYHEDRFGPDADAPDAATGADFLERWLGLFEGELTRMEDLVAESWRLTDPRITPAGALDWLAGWLGFALDPSWPAEVRRRLLTQATEQFRWRGTLWGLTMALDAVSDDAVARRDVIVLEGWRLRRTVATILGADLADEDDPLLAGLAVSGNSFVGDTLFLGDEAQKAFLALFRDDLLKSRSEIAQIDRLYDDLAHRVLVLVHAGLPPEVIGRVRRVVAREIPAHVVTEVHETDRSLIVGLSALVGVDTRPTADATARPFELGRSRLGIQDRLRQAPSLDPRLEGDV
ncbi:MAG: phage tail protein [Alphaproteobacteria bacterium]|nr:phage tail protein [Alphaproteobacteria bacterium]